MEETENGGGKVQFDAKIFKEEGCYGIGMCLRGRHGKYIQARTTWFQGLPQPHEAEARGLEEAIKWLGSLGLCNMYIELDCKQVVDNIDRRLSTNFIFVLF